MEQIFYTKDQNNEIYQCKIERLLIYVEAFSQFWAKNQFDVVLMEVKVAKLGNKVFAYPSVKPSSISISNIFLSVEDVRNNKPLFNVNSNRTQFEKTPFIDSIFFMKNNPPKNSLWATLGIFGLPSSACTRAQTWKWDGMNAVSTRVKSPFFLRAVSDPDYVVTNSYETLVYDVISRTYLYSLEQGETWLTKQECIDANAVQVHTF